MADRSGRVFFARVSALIGISTVILTASFVGILAFLSGAEYIPQLRSRLPWYILIAAVGFVGTIILLEANDAPGRVIIVTATISTLVTVVLVPLAVEGVLFALRNPDEVFVSQLFLYLLAGGLIGTGIGYWGINHWREFTRKPNNQL